MARGSGQGCRRVTAGHTTPTGFEIGVAAGIQKITVFGVEQQLQNEQLGAHSPPDLSVGQSSEHGPSPRTLPRPLVSNERHRTAATTRARNTRPRIA